MVCEHEIELIERMDELQGIVSELNDEKKLDAKTTDEIMAWAEEIKLDHAEAFAKVHPELSWRR